MRFPDESGVDLAAPVRAYRKASRKGILGPDDVPVSEPDPAREGIHAAATGHTKGLLQTA